ncbi:MAG: outer membrane lipoprotein carrier protein LolA [Bacteroidales bacterium]|nr:outer membrane lipoprotein carrier protein LolA [Bacteroidales bacterium]
MKRIVLIISMLICSITIWGQDRSAVVEKINAASQKITSLSCDFIQKKQVSILDESIVSSGKLFFAAGNKLCWEYIKPYTYSFIMNGSKVLLRSGDSSNVFDTKTNKMFSQISKLIMSGVDGSGITDYDNFDITVIDGVKEVIVTMVPKNRDVRKMFSRILLHFGKEDYFVKMIQMLEPSGDETSIEIINRKLNSAIDEKVFAIE